MAEEEEVSEGQGRWPVTVGLYVLLLATLCNGWFTLGGLVSIGLVLHLVLPLLGRSSQPPQQPCQATEVSSAGPEALHRKGGDVAPAQEGLAETEGREGQAEMPGAKGTGVETDATKDMGTAAPVGSGSDPEPQKMPWQITFILFASLLVTLSNGWTTCSGALGIATLLLSFWPSVATSLPDLAGLVSPSAADAAEGVARKVEVDAEPSGAASTSQLVPPTPEPAQTVAAAAGKCESESATGKPASDAAAAVGAPSDAMPWRFIVGFVVFSLVAPVLLKGLKRPQFSCRARSPCRNLEPEDMILSFQRQFEKSSHTALTHPTLTAGLETMRRRMPPSGSSSRRHTVLCIGPHELKEDFTDFVELERQLTPKHILVEPNPDRMRGLRKSLDEIGAERDRTKIIVAGVCHVDHPEAPFYTSRSALTQDSFDPSVVATYPDVKVMLVRCLSPLMLMQEAGILPADIDVMVMDAEGSDLPLLDLFLRLPGFLPAIIQFECCYNWEHKGLPPNLPGTLNTLTSLGYDILLVGADILATHESLRSGL